MTRLLALLCGFFVVLSCILAGLLFKRTSVESTSDVNANTHVSVNTPTLDSANTRVQRDLEDLVDRDAERWEQERQRRQKQENLDALISTGLRISTDAQAWSLKPQAFGGPAEDESIADVQFTDIGYANVEDGVFPTIDGRFWLESDNVALVVVGENRMQQNRIVVTVSGPAPSDIHMRVVPE